MKVSIDLSRVGFTGLESYFESSPVLHLESLEESIIVPGLDFAMTRIHLKDKNLAPGRGLEPPTTGLTARRST